MSWPGYTVKQPERVGNMTGESLLMLIFLLFVRTSLFGGSLAMLHNYWEVVPVLTYWEAMLVVVTYRVVVLRGK